MRSNILVSTICLGLYPLAEEQPNFFQSNQFAQILTVDRKEASDEKKISSISLENCAMMMIIPAMMMMLAKGAMRCATLGAGRGMWHSERWHSFLEYHPHYPSYNHTQPTYSTIPATHGTTNWFSVIDDTKQPYNQPCSQPSNRLTNQPTKQPTEEETKQLTKKTTIPTNQTTK